jgi:hypothetical protein
VFFKFLGVPFEYEKEGFQFPDGKRYLPDFWIPSLKLWVEIKGELTWVEKTIPPTKYCPRPYTYSVSPELELCEKFKEAQEWPVACVVGQPGHERIWFWGWDLTDSSGGSFSDDDCHWCHSNGRFTLNVNRGRDTTFYSDNLMGETMPQFEWPYEDGFSIKMVEKAVVAARQARFDHQQ